MTPRGRARPPSGWSFPGLMMLFGSSACLMAWWQGCWRHCTLWLVSVAGGVTPHPGPPHEGEEGSNRCKWMKFFASLCSQKEGVSFLLPISSALASLDCFARARNDGLTVVVLRGGRGGGTASRSALRGWGCDLERWLVATPPHPGPPHEGEGEVIGANG